MKTKQITVGANFWEEIRSLKTKEAKSPCDGFMRQSEAIQEIMDKTGESRRSAYVIFSAAVEKGLYERKTFPIITNGNRPFPVTYYRKVGKG